MITDFQLEQKLLRYSIVMNGRAANQKTNHVLHAINRTARFDSSIEELMRILHVLGHALQQRQRLIPHDWYGKAVELFVNALLEYGPYGVFASIGHARGQTLTKFVSMFD